MKKLFIFSCILVIALAGCKKYDTFQTNPNQPTTATPELLLTGVLYDIFYVDNTSSAYASRHLTYYERGNSSLDYSWRQGSFGNYNTLRQVQRMDSLATAENKSQFLGMTKLMRAILFDQLTEQFGDIPYSDALKGLNGNFTPTYDTQEEVFLGILTELEEANNLLDASKGQIGGDIIFNGDAAKWKKVANAFTLRILIHLSKKEGNASLNIKERFRKIIETPAIYPLMEGNADNARLVFNTSAPNNYYPTFGNLGLATAVSLEKDFVDILKQRNDPRLFAFGEPIAGKAANNFANYDGVDAGLTINDQQKISSTASRIKSRFHNDEVNEPLIFLGYAEQEFLIAEGIKRGWASGAAKTHYDNGIRGSMEFYGVASSAISTYLAQSIVAYNNEAALTQIAIQKHIAMYMNSGWETFYEQRRTGIPGYNVGPGTYNDMKVPKRWTYPQSEYDYNNENVTAAVQSQYGGDDDVNQEMWLLK